MSDDYQQQAEALVARWLDDRGYGVRIKANNHVDNFDLDDLRGRFADALRAAAEQAASEEREACAEYAKRYVFDGLCLTEREANNIAHNIRHRRDPERHE